LLGCKFDNDAKKCVGAALKAKAKTWTLKVKAISHEAQAIGHKVKAIGHMVKATGHEVKAIKFGREAPQPAWPRSLHQ